MDKIKFGILLAELRKESDLTQQAFAEIFHVSFQAVSKWENGESLPDISTLEQISKFYDITINDLLNGERNQVKEEHFKEEKTNQCCFTTKCVSSRLVKLVVSISVLFIYLLLSFMPFVNISTQSFSFYGIIFSSYYQIGNVFLLISFLTFISAGIMGIISVFNEKNIKIIAVEEIFLIFSFMLYILMFVGIISNASSGAYFMAITLITYIGAFIICKYLNFNVTVANKNQVLCENLGVYFLIIIHSFNMVRSSDFSIVTSIIFFAISLMFLLAGIIFTILYNLKNKKIYLILQMTFTTISIILTSIITQTIGLFIVFIFFVLLIILREYRINHKKSE